MICARIDAAKVELGETQEDLEPVKGEIDKLEEEYRELQQQIIDERSKNPPASHPFPFVNDRAGFEFSLDKPIFLYIDCLSLIWPMP